MDSIVIDVCNCYQIKHIHLRPQAKYLTMMNGARCNFEATNHNFGNNIAPILCKSRFFRKAIPPKIFPPNLGGFHPIGYQFQKKNFNTEIRKKQVPILSLKNQQNHLLSFLTVAQSKRLCFKVPTVCYFLHCSNKVYALHWHRLSSVLLVQLQKRNDCDTIFSDYFLVDAFEITGSTEQVISIKDTYINMHTDVVVLKITAVHLQKCLLLHKPFKLLINVHDQYVTYKLPSIQNIRVQVTDSISILPTLVVP